MKLQKMLIVYLSAMTCPAIEPPEMGKIILPCREEYDVMCLLKCKKGYHLEGSNQMSCKLKEGQTYWDRKMNCTGEM